MVPGDMSWWTRDPIAASLLTSVPVLCISIGIMVLIAQSKSQPNGPKHAGANAETIIAAVGVVLAVIALFATVWQGLLTQTALEEQRRSASWQTMSIRSAGDFGRREAIEALMQEPGDFRSFDVTCDSPTRVRLFGREICADLTGLTLLGGGAGEDRTVLSLTVDDASLARSTIRNYAMLGSYADTILTGSDWSRLSFWGANFANADFGDAELTDVTFVGVNFAGADLSQAVFSNVQVVNANISGTWLCEKDGGQCNETFWQTDALASSCYDAKNPPHGLDLLEPTPAPSICTEPGGP